MIGVALARIFMPTMSAYAELTVFSICMAILAIILIFCATIVYYKVYLVRKYCPDIEVKESKIEVKW